MTPRFDLALERRKRQRLVDSGVLSWSAIRESDRFHLSEADFETMYGQDERRPDLVLVQRCRNCERFHPVHA